VWKTEKSYRNTEKPPEAAVRNKSPFEVCPKPPGSTRNQGGCQGCSLPSNEGAKEKKRGGNNARTEDSPEKLRRKQMSPTSEDQEGLEKATKTKKQ